MDPTILIPFSPKNPPSFSCELCDYFTCNKKDYKKHLLTIKHISLINPTQKSPKCPKTEFICPCGKKYKHSSTLSKHKKICKPQALIEADIPTPPVDTQIMSIILKDNNDFKNLILDVVRNNAELQRQNQEFQKEMMELYKNGGGGTGGSGGLANNMIIGNNNNNKTFNMQVFLNEKCKDAMDIKEFIDSFQLNFDDLENVGEVGYVQGISDLIVKKLSAIDVCKRPIHCSDIKRETMYIHENNVWVKDNATHDRLRLIIRYIAKKNSDLLTPWYNAHPGVEYSEHRLNDKYMHMVMQAMGGKSTQFTENEDKVMRRIAKTVLIEK